MENAQPVSLTPEQAAAVRAGNGVAHLLDPETQQVYVVIEQGRQPTLSEEYFREKIQQGIREKDRGECEPWDPEKLKSELRERHAARNLESE